MAAESKLERAFCAEVRAAGGDVRKVAWPGRRGAPDRLVAIPGRNAWHHFYVELKAPGKEPSVLQQREYMKLADLGFIVVVIDDEDKAQSLVRAVLNSAQDTPSTLVEWGLNEAAKKVLH